MKHVATTIKRLKNARNDTKLNEYENMVFQFPTSMKRKPDMQAYQGNVKQITATLWFEVQIYDMYPAVIWYSDERER